MNEFLIQNAKGPEYQTTGVRNKRSQTGGSGPRHSLETPRTPLTAEPLSMGPDTSGIVVSPL